MKKQKKLIASDFHGIFVDALSIREIRARVAKDLFGIKITPENCCKDYVLSNALLTLEQLDIIYQHVYGDIAYTQSMRPTQGLIKILPQIIKDQSELLIITSVTGVMLRNAKEWWIQNISKECPLFIGVGVGGDRSGLLQEYNVTAYIDDSVENLGEIQKNITSGIKLFLFDCIDNEGVAIPHGIRRVFGWEDFHQKFQALQAYKQKIIADKP